MYLTYSLFKHLRMELKISVNIFSLMESEKLMEEYKYFRGYDIKLTDRLLNTFNTE